MAAKGSEGRTSSCQGLDDRRVRDPVASAQGSRRPCVDPGRAPRRLDCPPRITAARRGARSSAAGARVLRPLMGDAASGPGPQSGSMGALGSPACEEAVDRHRPWPFSSSGSTARSRPHQVTSASALLRSGSPGRAACSSLAATLTDSAVTSASVPVTPLRCSGRSWLVRRRGNASRISALRAGAAHRPRVPVGRRIRP